MHVAAERYHAAANRRALVHRVLAIAALAVLFVLLGVAGSLQ